MNLDATKLNEFVIEKGRKLNEKTGVTFDELLVFSALVTATNIIDTVLIDGDSPTELALYALEVVQSRVSNEDLLKEVENMMDKLEEALI